MQHNLISPKIRLIYTGMLVLAVALVVFAFRWQVLEGGKFTQLAASRFKDSVIPSLRGTIYAADGSTLAYSEPRYNLFAYVPELLFAEEKGLQSRSEFVNKVAGALEISAADLEKLLSENYQKGVYWIKIGEALDLPKREAIIHLSRDVDSHLPEEQRAGLAGFFFEYTSRRI